MSTIGIARPPLTTFVHPRPTCIPSHAGKLCRELCKAGELPRQSPTLSHLAASVASVQDEGPRPRRRPTRVRARYESSQLSCLGIALTSKTSCDVPKVLTAPCQRGSTSPDWGVVEIEAWWWAAIMIKPAMVSPAGHDNLSSSPTRWFSHHTQLHPSPLLTSRSNASLAQGPLGGSHRCVGYRPGRCRRSSQEGGSPGCPRGSSSSPSSGPSCGPSSAAAAARNSAAGHPPSH